MTPESNNARPDQLAEPRKASLLQTVSIVMSGLAMIERKCDFGASAPRINPVLLVIVELVGIIDTLNAFKIEKSQIVFALTR